ncbi:MAG: hypothetical protein V1646_03905 [bacterium]
MKVENSKHNKISRISVLVIFTAILIPSLFSLTKKFILSAKEKASTNLSFEKIEIEFENIYSKEVESEIREFAKNQIQKATLLSFDQNEFYKNLKNNFSIIKQFECHINSLTIHLKIVGVKPYCMVNNNWVMCNKKQLFTTNLFDQFDLTNLKNISLNDKSLKNPLPKNLYCFIKQVPQDHWEAFDINFVKSTEIYLTPKNQALNYCFVTNEKNIFDKPKVTKAQGLYKKLMYDENFIKKMKRKRNHKLVLDLRFKNRIVTSFVATKLENNGREGGQ